MTLHVPSLSRDQDINIHVLRHLEADACLKDCV